MFTIDEVRAIPIFSAISAPDLERLAKCRERIAPGNSRLPAKRIKHYIRAGERSSVTTRGSRGRLGTACLDQGDGFAGGTRLLDRSSESGGVFDTLDI